MENKFKNTKRVAIFILVFVISIIGVRYYSRINHRVTENTVKARPVRAMEIKEETYPITLDYIGTINTEEIKNISFKIPGKVEKINVSEGDFVSKGMAMPV